MAASSFDQKARVDGGDGNGGEAGCGREDVAARAFHREHAMLVLSRKQGEAIVVDGRVVVTVERISPHRVRLVIDAPDDVRVDRREVWLRKQEGKGPVASH